MKNLVVEQCYRKLHKTAERGMKKARRVGFHSKGQTAFHFWVETRGMKIPLRDKTDCNAEEKYFEIRGTMQPMASEK